MAGLSVRKRPNSSKWEYRFDGASINGKRTQYSKSGFKTKAEATRAGNEAITEYNNSGLSFVPSEISVSDFLDLWINEYCKTNLNESTVTNYKKKIRLYIKPEIGKYKLKAITPIILEGLINNLFHQGYSRNTIAVIKGIITGSFRYAVKMNFIRINPTHEVKMPLTNASPEQKTRSAPHIYLQQEQIDRIFSRFPYGSSVYIPMNFGYRCGNRIGEAYAFFWEDVDFEHSTITVRKQVQWSEDSSAWYFSDPKYGSSRVNEIDSNFLEILKKEKEMQEQAKKHYREHYVTLYENSKRQINSEGDGKVIHPICVRENGEYIHPRTMQHTSKVIHTQLGIPDFDFHSFRVTHTTLLIEAGADLKYVQKRLGHKNASVTTQIYQRLTENMENRSIDILENQFGIK